MDHPDFRVGGKIFATLGPDLTWAMAKLSPEQQKDLSDKHPNSFKPASGKWGDGGATLIILAEATSEIAGEALTLAYENTVQAKEKK